LDYEFHDNLGHDLFIYLLFAFGVTQSIHDYNKIADMVPKTIETLELCNEFTLPCLVFSMI